MTNEEKTGILKLLNIVKHVNNEREVYDLVIARDLQSYCRGTLFFTTISKYGFLCDNNKSNNRFMITGKGKLFLKLMENKKNDK